MVWQSTIDTCWLVPVVVVVFVVILLSSSSSSLVLLFTVTCSIIFMYFTYASTTQFLLGGADSTHPLCRSDDQGLLNSLYCWSVCAVCTFNRALCGCTYNQGSATKLTFTANVNSQLVNSVFFFEFPVGIRVGHQAETMRQHWLKAVLRNAQAGVSWGGHVDETLSYIRHTSTDVLQYVHADVAWDYRAY